MVLGTKDKCGQEAGFDGFTTFSTSTHARLAEELKLTIIGLFLRAIEFDRLICQNVDNGAYRINVHFGDHDTSTPQALSMALRFFTVADKLGARLSVEVHRDTCTETPEETYALAEAFRKATGQFLRFTWDF